MHYLDMLTDQDLGLAVITSVEATQGYIRWFYSISHPHLILSDEAIHILRRAEQEARDEVIVEQEGKHGCLELTGRLGRIKDHILPVLVSGVVETWTDEWNCLESIFAEVHEGWVYRRRHGRGPRAQFYGVVVF